LSFKFSLGNNDIPEGAPWPEFEELASPGSIDLEMIQWYSQAVAK